MATASTRRWITSFGAVIMATAMWPATATPTPDPSRPRAPMAAGMAVDTGRLAGPNRYATAVEIAKRSFPDGAPVAYLARGDAFADALAAGTLTDGPILLTPPCGDLPAVVAEEIARLDPARVIALGGTGAVCDAVLGQAASGRSSGRVAGSTRYETAIRIAERAFPDGAESVYLANGADSPDAVAGGALTDGPILLLPASGNLVAAVTAAVDALDPDRVVALGGTAVVTDEQLTGTAGDRATDRLAGPDRYATAAAIALEAQGSSPPAIYLARGDVFADAVAAGSLTDGPVVLVPTCGDLPAAPAFYLGNAATAEVIALGGDAAVCDSLLTASGALPTPAGQGGTIVYERRRHDEELDREIGEIWASDADGTKPRLLVAPDVQEVQDDYSYSEPSIAGIGGTDVVMKGSAVGHSATACDGTFCTAHVGFHQTGVVRWRDGQAGRETPRPEYCSNCSTFFTHPEITVDGHWVAWYEHYQGGTITYVNDWTLGTPDGEWEFTGNRPCESDEMGPIAAHPLEPEVVAFVACTTGGNHDVFVATRDGARQLRVASVPVDDDSFGNHLAVGWTTLSRLIVRVADLDNPQDAGFYLFDPTVPAEEQDEPTLILREIDGVVFGSPTQIVGGRLLFHVRDVGDPDVDDDTTWDLWTVPSDCRGCTFPDDATQLTDDGRSRNPDFTGEHRFDLHHAPPG